MKRLLLVDDHAAFRECLALLIAPGLGCAGVHAGTPDEARRVLADAEGGIRLSIVDLDLPGDGAAGLIGELREAAKDAPVLAYTDGRDPRARARAQLAGAEEVISLHEPARRLLDAAARLGGARREEIRQG